jgi:hypothetical protein
MCVCKREIWGRNRGRPFIRGAAQKKEGDLREFISSHVLTFIALTGSMVENFGLRGTRAFELPAKIHVWQDAPDKIF